MTDLPKELPKCLKKELWARAQGDHKKSNEGFNSGIRHAWFVLKSEGWHQAKDCVVHRGWCLEDCEVCYRVLTEERGWLSPSQIKVKVEQLKNKLNKNVFKQTSVYDFEKINQLIDKVFFEGTK